MQQQSNAVRVLEDDFGSSLQTLRTDVDTTSTEREPQFGDRPNPKAAPVQKITPVIQRITQESIIHVKTPEEKLNEECAPQVIALPNLSAYKGRENVSMLGTLIETVLSNIITYLLVLVAVTLPVFKIYLVQQTHTMTAKYNEAKSYNASLDKEWLTLLSEREALTEYSVIRKHATEDLQMVQPKTEDEFVIDLRQ